MYLSDPYGYATVEFHAHAPAVIVNVIVYLDGLRATVPDAGLINAIS